MGPISGSELETVRQERKEVRKRAEEEAGGRTVGRASPRRESGPRFRVDGVRRLGTEAGVGRSDRGVGVPLSGCQLVGLLKSRRQIVSPG